MTQQSTDRLTFIENRIADIKGAIAEIESDESDIYGSRKYKDDHHEMKADDAFTDLSNKLKALEQERDELKCLEAEPQVALAWATKKRHIAIDGKVLCQPKASTGYSVSNGCYNTLGLSGVPTHKRTSPDVKYTHCDGLIEFKPLSEQSVFVDTKSVCKQCQRKYQQALAGNVVAGITSLVIICLMIAAPLLSDNSEWLFR
jgi:hypothetical protein